MIQPNNKVTVDPNLDYTTRKYHKQETASEKLDRVLDDLWLDLPSFFKSFIPCVGWLPKYNRVWLLGDIISGFTLGVMLVPQTVAYSKLAQIPVQYGLYSTFIANLIYAIFGGSREIAVGPNAVLSLFIGSAVQAITAIEGNLYTPAQIGAAMATMFAFISLGLGCLRLGVLLELIPAPVIVGFTTGAASTIMLSQLGTMLGIPNINTTKPTWGIIADLIMNVPNITWLNLVFGIITFIFLLVLPIFVNKFNKRLPVLNYLAIGANAIAVILFTVISLILFKSIPDLNLTIVKSVPSGFSYIGAPVLSSDLWNIMLPYAPGLFLVAILEHTAVVKNFSAKVGYQVSISQEFFAVGVANLLGSFFSGFTVSGSLSRGAVLSRSGVRTPFAGIFIGIVLLASLEFLTPAFYYIPNASLGAIIMRAGISLIPTYSSMKELWTTNIVDFFVFSVAAIVTFFLGVQYGIGSAVAISFIYLIYNIARPKFYILGEVKGREIFVDKYHPNYVCEDAEPGVIIFRIQESIIFPNITFLRERLMNHVLEFSKSGAPPILSKDRLWSSDINDRALRLRKARALRNRNNGMPTVVDEASIPYLKAVVLDLGAVNYIDASGIQGLKELKDQLYLYAGAHPSQASYFGIERPQFELHFVSIHLKVLRSITLSQLPLPMDYIIKLDSFDLEPKGKPINNEAQSNDPVAAHNLAVVEDDIISVTSQSNHNDINLEHLNPSVALQLDEELNRTIIQPEIDRAIGVHHNTTGTISGNDDFDARTHIEPIILNNLSPYIHLSVMGAVTRIRRNMF